MLSRISRLALSALLLPGSAASAAEFTANHLFVGDFSGLRIHEFDTSGAKVGEIGAAIGVRVEGIAFGPNGHLYASDFVADRVFEFDASGAVVKQLGSGTQLDGPAHLAFGPRGHLFVVSSNTDEIFEFNTSGQFVGTITAGSNLDSQCGIAFGPEGNLYVSFGSADRVGVFDVLGGFLGQIGSSALLDDPSGLAFGPDGRLYVSSILNDRVVVMTVEGVQLDTIGIGSGLASPRGLAFGADGHLYVASSDTHSVFEFDGSGAKVSEFGAADGVNSAMGIAFAPFRFKTKVKGTLGREGAAWKTFQENDAVLSIAPGARILQLALKDHGTGQDLAAALASSVVVVHGFAGFEHVFAKKRLFEGQEIRSVGSKFGCASLTARTTGTTDGSGFHRVKTAKGSLHHAGPGAVLEATVASSSLLE